MGTFMVSFVGSIDGSVVTTVEILAHVPEVSTVELLAIRTTYHVVAGAGRVVHSDLLTDSCTFR
jgi:hypothetical protein